MRGWGLALQTSIFASQACTMSSEVPRRRLKFEVPAPFAEKRQIAKLTRLGLRTRLVLECERIRLAGVALPARIHDRGIGPPERRTSKRLARRCRGAGACVSSRDRISSSIAWASSVVLVRRTCQRDLTSPVESNISGGKQASTEAAIFAFRSAFGVWRLKPV